MHNLVERAIFMRKKLDDNNVSGEQLSNWRNKSTNDNKFDFREVRRQDDNSKSDAASNWRSRAKPVLNEPVKESLSQSSNMYDVLSEIEQSHSNEQQNNDSLKTKKYVPPSLRNKKTS
jgi:hypothetical protein